MSDNSRVFILETLPQWLTQILSDLIHPNASHRPHSQGSDEWVAVFTVLDKCVHCHDSHVGMRLGVVHQVEIHKLLEFQIVSLHTVDNIGKQSRHVLAHGHGGNDLLERKILYDHK